MARANVVALLLLSLVGFSQANDLYFTGNVVDCSGAAVTGAFVVVTGCVVESDPLPYAFTNSTGGFITSQVNYCGSAASQNQCQITVTRPGATPTSTLATTEVVFPASNLHSINAAYGGCCNPPAGAVESAMCSAMLGNCCQRDSGVTAYIYSQQVAGAQGCCGSLGPVTLGLGNIQLNSNTNPCTACGSA
jgi:hypothetical protein